MRAAIYNPYLDTLGGGERYTVSFAQALVSNGYEVDIQWKNTIIKKKLEDRFGIKLKGINFIKNIRRGDGYEVCFWISDGSIPILRARKNFLHFQFPFKDVNGKSLLNKMKLFRISSIIVNSYFTKSFIDEEYGVESTVIYPPVDTVKIKPRRKENLILAVGRFSRLTQAKRQDVLIDTFKKLCKSGLSGWRLVLAGGVEVGVDDYIEKLRKKSRGYPIEFIESPKFEKLKELYGRAKIFWSSTGFGVNENKEPVKVEHFGISIVEAMAASVVPLATNLGGHKEIISDGVNGYLWKKSLELMRKTKQLINEPKLLRKMANHVRSDSKVYEYERFETEVGALLK